MKNVGDPNKENGVTMKCYKEKILEKVLNIKFTMCDKKW